MQRLRSQLWLNVLLVGLFWSSSAHAQSTSDGTYGDDPLEGLFGDVSAEDARRAVELAQQARAAYDEDNIGGALAYYEQAFDLSHDPAFAFNLGALYEAVGELPRARSYLGAYLELYPDAPNRAAVQEQIAGITATLQREWAPVRFSADVAGASVLLVRGDEEFLLGSSPLERWLRPGDYVFRFRQRGWFDADLSTDLAAGGVTELTGMLQPRSMQAQRLTRRCAISAAGARCGSPDSGS
jgi:tetratricopeptide (TPR) repeat protein